MIIATESLPGEDRCKEHDKLALEEHTEEDDGVREERIGGDEVLDACHVALVLPERSHKILDRLVPVVENEIVRFSGLWFADQD